MDWLFEQYDKEDLAIIDNDNKDDNDDQVKSLMLFRLTDKIHHFRDDLVTIME